MSRQPLTFGSVHAIASKPTRDGSMWGNIAVVNRPGIPFRYDENCQRNTIYLIDESK